jgi:hypothetical protein
MNVSLGTNTFSNCQALLAVKDFPVLKVAFDPFRLTMRTPSDLPSRVSFTIEDSAIVRADGPAVESLRVIKDVQSIAVFWGESWLAVGVLLDPNNAKLRVDLRAIGMKVYDDEDGLHVGANTLSRNAFANCSTAIALG